jgi:hypothetical protein
MDWVRLAAKISAVFWVGITVIAITGGSPPGIMVLNAIILFGTLTVVLGSIALGDSLSRRYSARFKLCEHCSARIKSTAKVCRYCGRDLSSHSGASKI